MALATRTLGKTGVDVTVLGYGATFGLQADTGSNILQRRRLIAPLVEHLRGGDQDLLPPLLIEGTTPGQRHSIPFR